MAPVLILPYRFFCQPHTAPHSTLLTLVEQIISNLMHYSGPLMVQRVRRHGLKTLRHFGLTRGELFTGTTLCVQGHV
eukprot:scaffold39028_cov16-Tisochrysis_lutea.AAC.3